MDVTPGEAKVERLGIPPEHTQEGKEEPTHARIDVAEDPPLRCQSGDVGDGIDDAVGIRRRRTDHHDGGVRAGIGQRRDVDAEVRADRDADQFDVEVVRRLGECGVRALRRHDPGVPDPPVLACHVARRLDRLEEALGPTGRQVALHVPAGGRIVGAEQRGRVAHDVVLHDADTRERQHVEPVLGAVQRLGILQELVHLVAGRVDEAEDTPTPPILVALLHGQQPGQDIGAGKAQLGYGRVREPVHE